MFASSAGMTSIGQTDSRRLRRRPCSLPLEGAILNGELVIFREDGVTDFQALQNYVEERRAGGKLAYVIYDLPHCGGYDLTHTPLIERKTFLETVLKGPGGKNGIIRYSEHVLGQGGAFLKAASEHSLEGIVSKRVTSAYLQKRTRAWLKLKFYKCGEFIVVGYTKPTGSRQGFGALLLGYRKEDGWLTYAGRVGTGFNDRSLLSISGSTPDHPQRPAHLWKTPGSLAGGGRLGRAGYGSRGELLRLDQ